MDGQGLRRRVREASIAVLGRTQGVLDAGSLIDFVLRVLEQPGVVEGQRRELPEALEDLDLASPERQLELARGQPQDAHDLAGGHQWDADHGAHPGRPIRVARDGMAS